MRQEFTRKQRAQAFERCGGRCEECGAKLKPGETEFDHVIPCALGGEATLENCSVKCRACHGTKTAKSDAPTIAKVKRIHAKHHGIWPASLAKIQSRGFPKRVDFWPPLSSGDEHD